MGEFYLCSLPLPCSGWETSCSKRICCYLRKHFLSKGQQREVLGTKAHRSVWRMWLGFQLGCSTRTARLSLWGAPTTFGCRSSRVCPRVTWHRCPAQGDTGWQGHSTARPFSGSFQSKLLSHSSSGSDSRSAEEVTAACRAGLRL